MKSIISVVRTTLCLGIVFVAMSGLAHAQKICEDSCEKRYISCISFFLDLTCSTQLESCLGNCFAQSRVSPEQRSTLVETTKQEIVANHPHPDEPAPAAAAPAAPTSGPETK
jgi:hypothetical protein